MCLNPDLSMVFVITELFDLSEFQRYKDFELISSSGHAHYTDASDNTLKGVENILLDIILLSRCEYVVCTLSSNVGRVVYEILSLKHANVTERLVSLDVSYSLQ